MYMLFKNGQELRYRRITSWKQQNSDSFKFSMSYDKCDKSSLKHHIVKEMVVLTVYLSFQETIRTKRVSTAIKVHRLIVVSHTDVSIKMSFSH
jgi:hypothetical protein